MYGFENKHPDLDRMMSDSFKKDPKGVDMVDKVCDHLYPADETSAFPKQSAAVRLMSSLVHLAEGRSGNTYHTPLEKRTFKVSQWFVVLRQPAFPIPDPTIRDYLTERGYMDLVTDVQGVEHRYLLLFCPYTWLGTFYHQWKDLRAPP